MGNDRTDSAREHDDSALIDRAGSETPSQQGRSGGNLATDIATQAARERVRDPEASEGVDKQDDIAHGQRTPVSPRPDKSSGGSGA